MTLALNHESLPTLLAPTRLDVFATRDIVKGKGKRAKTSQQSIGYQGWNPDAMMEHRMARLEGSGSFYWPNAIMAHRAAKQMMTADSSIHQIKIETISGREIGRMYR